MFLSCRALVGCVIIGGFFAPAVAWSQTARSAPKTPYGKLFQPSDLNASAAPVLDAARAQARAEVTERSGCTMRIIPVDPSVDPKIRVEPNTGDTRHTIRVIPPPPCK